MASAHPAIRLQPTPVPRPKLSDVDPSAVVSARLERTLKGLSKQAFLYEHEMKDLESRLSENLSNFRAIDGLLGGALHTLQANSRRASKARQLQVPHINEELDESAEVLEELADTLPTVKTQVEGIRDIYDSGRQKAQDLVDDLTWLNTEFYERWRQIIFTSSSPVSWRWKIIVRTVFTISFILCCWVSWIALRGAYRAHRHRLVWGDKLMS